jgi:putative aldouronate transport system permease protein
MESLHAIKKTNAIHERKTKRNGSQIQQLVEISVLIVSIGLFVLPFINLFCVSVSSSRAILTGEVYFYPIEIQWDAWRGVFSNKTMMSSFLFTIVLTATYTVLAEVLIMLAAYPLSRKDLIGRNKFTNFFLFTMYFSGGLIPSYLLVQSLGLLDTYLALIIPGAFSVYNMLILKSFFQGIPDSLEESARLDGANDFQILFQIYFPLSLPALATLALFFAVGRWNSFSDAIFYMPTNKALIPLQLVLQKILKVVGDKEVSIKEATGAYTSVRIVSESQKAANILFTVVPIIIVYPWLQKYFVKGVMIGSIKG